MEFKRKRDHLNRQYVEAYFYQPLGLPGVSDTLSTELRSCLTKAGAERFDRVCRKLRLDEIAPLTDAVTKRMKAVLPPGYFVQATDFVRFDHKDGRRTYRQWKIVCRTPDEKLSDGDAFPAGFFRPIFRAVRRGICEGLHAIDNEDLRLDVNQLYKRVQPCVEDLADFRRRILLGWAEKLSEDLFFIYDAANSSGGHWRDIDSRLTAAERFAYAKHLFSEEGIEESPKHRLEEVREYFWDHFDDLRSLGGLSEDDKAFVLALEIFSAMTRAKELWADLGALPIRTFVRAAKDLGIASPEDSPKKVFTDFVSQALQRDLRSLLILAWTLDTSLARECARLTERFERGTFTTNRIPYTGEALWSVFNRGY